jgi:hypothetical protein
VFVIVEEEITENVDVDPKLITNSFEQFSPQFIPDRFETIKPIDEAEPVFEIVKSCVCVCIFVNEAKTVVSLFKIILQVEFPEQPPDQPLNVPTIIDE